MCKKSPETKTIIISKDNYFSELAAINIEKLNEFYSLVKNQTQKSFALAAVASCVGFIFILSGFLYSMTPSNNTQLVNITSIAGAIVEAIAGLFFFLYNKTVRQLKDYHKDIVNVQNILLVFRMHDIYPEGTSKEVLAHKIVESILKNNEAPKT